MFSLFKNKNAKDVDVGRDTSFLVEPRDTTDMCALNFGIRKA